MHHTSIKIVGLEMKCINHKPALNIKLGPIYMNNQGLSNERLPMCLESGDCKNPIADTQRYGSATRISGEKKIAG
jgi:hypothetical protein